MSMFSVTGLVQHVYFQPSSPDKETGEVKPGTSKVQILGQLPVRGGGSKMDLITLTIPDGLDFTDYINQEVSVPLGFFSPSKGSIIYFIPKGSSIRTTSQASAFSASLAGQDKGGGTRG